MFNRWTKLTEADSKDWRRDDKMMAEQQNLKGFVSSGPQVLVYAENTTRGSNHVRTSFSIPKHS